MSNKKSSVFSFTALPPVRSTKQKSLVFWVSKMVFVFALASCTPIPGNQSDKNGPTIYYYIYGDYANEQSGNCELTRVTISNRGIQIILDGKSILDGQLKDLQVFEITDGPLIAIAARVVDTEDDASDIWVVFEKSEPDLATYSSMAFYAFQTSKVIATEKELKAVLLPENQLTGGMLTPCVMPSETSVS